MSDLCLCLDCRALREDEAEQAACAAERALAGQQLRLPMSPLPHLAGAPSGLLPTETQQELFG